LSLVSLSDAKTYLGLSGSDNDSIITGMLAAIDKRFELFCHRLLNQATVTEILDGTGNGRLWLPQPAESITSIHIDSNQEWSDDNLVAAADYTLVPSRSVGRSDGVLVERDDNQVWTHGDLNVRVIFSAGFASVPDDLADAVKVQFAMDYQKWDASKKGFNIVQQNREEDWDVKFLAHSSLHPLAREVLEAGYMNPAD
jgi:hypothetical protein